MGLDLADAVAEVDLFGDDAVGDFCIGFDLDAPRGVEESSDDDHGGCRTDEGEEFAVDLGGGLPVLGAGEVDAGAVDVLDGAAGLFEREGDEGEALVGLLGDVGVVGTYGAGAGDVDLVADADGSGEADGLLVWRCAGDVRADRHRDILCGSFERCFKVFGYYRQNRRELDLWRLANVCFSATANFVGSGVLGAVGVVTLTKVKHKRELLFASLPALFAVHQFIEGFVWLGLDGVLSPTVTHNMGAAFVLYAQGLLPFLMPLSILLFEPDMKSRRRMLPFLAIGAGTTLYILWALIAYPLHIFVRGNSIVYINDGTNNTTLAVLYVIATCGSLFFSKERPMVLFGVANLTILLTVMAVKRYAFTSLWCAYAAIASVIILAYFWKSRLRRPFKYAEAIWG